MFELPKTVVTDSAPILQISFICCCAFSRVLLLAAVAPPVHPELMEPSLTELSEFSRSNELREAWPEPP